MKKGFWIDFLQTVVQSIGFALIAFVTLVDIWAGDYIKVLFTVVATLILFSLACYADSRKN